MQYICNTYYLFLALFLLLPACSTVTELGDSSGCLYTEGGPIPGVSSGKVTICRSGRDKATIDYRNGEIIIKIEHGEQAAQPDKVSSVNPIDLYCLPARFPSFFKDNTVLMNCADLGTWARYINQPRGTIP